MIKQLHANNANVSEKPSSSNRGPTVLSRVTKWLIVLSLFGSMAQEGVQMLNSATASVNVVAATVNYVSLMGSKQIDPGVEQAKRALEAAAKDFNAAIYEARPQDRLN